MSHFIRKRKKSDARNIKYKEICSICLDTLNSKECTKQELKIRILPCNHKFHDECIERWFKIDNSCPYCKSPP